MTNTETPDFDVAVELGSSHASILVAQERAGQINIMAFASLESSGMRKGHIVHFDSLVTTVQDLVDEAERQTGLSIENIRLGVAGSSAVSDNHTESAPLRHGEVRPVDVERIHTAARGTRAPQGLDFIQILATQFALDGQVGLVSPAGLLGSQLSCQYHRVAFPQNDLRNLVKACNHAGVHVESFIFEALAAAEAVLDADERELGSACLSIGHSLTHVAVYANGHPLFSKAIPVGAHHITKDLSVGLRLSQTEAERLKRDFGHAMILQDNAQEAVASIETSSGRAITHGEIGRIITPRVNEILEAAKHEISNFGLENIVSKGIVLTGGGALLNGICHAAESTFQTNARIGIPVGLVGQVEGTRTPAASGLVGMFAARFQNPAEPPTFLERMGSLRTANGLRSLAKGLWGRISEPFDS